jgi:hypothetical protein
MKTAKGLFAASVAVLSLVGVVFAQVTPARAADASSTSTSAEKPSKLAIPHRMTGDVVSVDQNAKMFTLKSAKGKELTFTAEGDAATHLGDLKAGDRVKVSYKNSHGHMVASKVAATQVATKVK